MNKQKILESKILIPEIRKEYEQREKLLLELQSEEGKLLVLCAAIGYGKTVLMSQFARLPGHICAWYHLDSLDNEFSNFIRYLTLSLCRALGSFGFDEELCLKEDAGYCTQLGRNFIMELEKHLKGMEEQKLVLVLDNFQVLENAEIMKLLEELLDYTDHRFLLVVITKGGIPDSFVKYLMRRQGTVIGAEQLSFQKTEVRSILDRMLSGKDAERYIEMIWENTEGWPAGVMLTALYLRRIGGSASDMKWEQISQESCLQKYITHELYKGLSQDMQRFLLSTSFAEELHPDLCNEICDIQNAAELLHYLFRNNMFLLRAGNKKDSYRYHPTFCSFLRNRAGEELQSSIGEKIAGYDAKCQDNVPAGKYAIVAEKTAKNNNRQLLEISCFGKFRVVILETGREISWRTRKALELFAYLVDLEGKPVERKVLLERLWPDYPPNNEIAMLHNMIYSIRKELRSQPELKNLIQYKEHRYYLDISRIKVDLESKKQICKLAELGNAKELYEHREELLAHWGVYLQEVEGTWCMARRTYFERTYGKACSQLAAYCREREDFETEISCWNAYLAADRYSEEAIEGLLHSYAHLGERQQMQRVFETAKKIFRDEMGIELSPDTVRIYEQGLKKHRS